MVTVGIDFGFCAIRVAVFREANEDEVAKVDLLPNDLGDRSTPTVLAFDRKIRLFGREAIANAGVFPENFVFGIKRIIGRRMDDEDLQKHFKYCYFEKNNKNHRLMIKIDGDSYSQCQAGEIENLERNFQNGYFESSQEDTKIDGSLDLYSQRQGRPPEELLSFIFSRVKEMAEQELYAITGEEKLVKTVVISVPCCFTHNQRQSVIDAAKIADIDVLHLINDSTAVAVNYVFDILEGESKKLLIFDFGASSLDVSLVDVNEFDIRVVAAAGSTSLGGVDFDNILIEHSIEKIRRQYRLDISNNKRLRHKLRKECETAKKTLQTMREARIRIDTPDNKELTIVVTRDEFDAMCGHLCIKAMSFVKKVVKESNLKKTDIDEVILIGGSSRLKTIENLIIAYFKGKRINRRLNVDEAVVNGTAIFAGSLIDTEDEKLQKLKVTQVTPFRVGFAKHNVKDAVINELNCNSRTTPVTIFIDRNEQIPISQESDVIDDFIDVVAGDSKMFELHTITSLGLINRLSSYEKVPIKFTLCINKNGIYEFDAKPIYDRYENCKQYYKHLTNFHLSKEDIESMKTNLQLYKADVAKEEKRVEAKNDLEKELFKLKQEVTSSQCELISGDYERLLQMINEKSQWIDCNGFASKQDLEQTKLELNSIKTHFKYSRENAEAERQQFFEILKSSVLKLSTDLENAKHIIGEEKVYELASLASNISEWVTNNTHESKSKFIEKIRDVHSIGVTLNALINKEHELRKELRGNLMEIVQEFTHKSPFKAYENWPQYSTLENELKDEIDYVESQMNTEPSPNASTINKIKQQLISFVEERIVDLRKEEEMTKYAKSQVTDELFKLQKLLKEPMKLRLTKNGEQNVNQIINETQEWLNENVFRTNDEYEKKKASLINQHSLITQMIMKENDRIAAKVELYNLMLSFWQQFLGTHNEPKYKKSDFETLNSEIRAIEQWYENNPLATIENLNKKMQELNDLKTTAREFMSKKDTEETVFVGIDIGTSYCCLSVFKNGEWEVISFDDYVRLPSYIAFVKGEIVFGSDAKNNIFDDPINTFYNVKRLLGRKRDDSFYAELKYLTYSVDHNIDKLKVDVKSSKFPNFNQKKLAVEEITALMLIKMKITAEEYLKKKVSIVTISVPSTFRNSQRQSIYDAAIIAGFQEVKLVNDTVAITLKHVWESLVKENVNHENRKILVFSMGAGYTSITVLEVKNSSIEVKAHGGKDFGGYEFDKCLFDLVSKRSRKGQIEKSTNYINFLECEASKIALSSKKETNVIVDKQFRKNHGVLVTQAEFEESSKSLFAEIFNAIRATIDAAKVNRYAINEVLICGGSSNIPKIINFLSAHTGNATMTRCEDESVAIGCSIHSAITKSDTFKFIRFIDRSNFTYTFENKTNEKLIIERYSKLPAFVDGVLKASCDYQCEYSTKLFESTAAQNSMIYDKSLLTPSSFRKNKVAFKIKMKVDENGLLSLTATECKTETETPFLVKSRLSGDEIKRMTIDTEKHLKQFATPNRLNEEKRKLLDTITEYRKLLNDTRKFVSSSQLSEAEKALASASILIQERCTPDMCETSRRRIVNVFRKILEQYN